MKYDLINFIPPLWQKIQDFEAKLEIIAIHLYTAFNISFT